MSAIPSIEQVRTALGRLRYVQLADLAGRSGVPFHTLRKIRDGETQNPGLQTVSRFWPELIGTEGAPPPPAEGVRDAA